MSVIPLPRQTERVPQTEGEPSPVLRLAAGGTLLAGALLLLAGKRKAGLAATAAGTALTLLQEKETTLRWWAALPLMLSNAQRFMGHAQDVVDEVNVRKQKFQGVFRK